MLPHMPCAYRGIKPPSTSSRNMSTNGTEKFRSESQMRSCELILDRVSKIYDATQVPAVNDVTLEVEQGQFVTMLGPSGCGKTTLLRMIGGFVVPSAGRVLVRGEDVTDLPPQRRPTAMVFQNYALFPHMTVTANVAFGLRVRRVPKGQIAEVVMCGKSE